MSRQKNESNLGGCGCAIVIIVIIDMIFEGIRNNAESITIGFLVIGFIVLLYFLNKMRVKSKNEDSFFCNFQSADVILDSNIWMDNELDKFFEALKIHRDLNYSIIMPTVQYDEICNIKKGDGKSKKYGARIALRRIESFQESNLLEFGTMLGDVSSPNAYFDSYLIKLMDSQNKKDRHVIVITNDRDLRIRLKSRGAPNDANYGLLKKEDIPSHLIKKES